MPRRWSMPSGLRIIGSDPVCRELQAMSEEGKLIDLSAERAKRIHDLNDKRLNEVRSAFEQAMPLGRKKKSKSKPKKR
jgi:hypothetical protein